ncbi:MAG TPA: SDR family NAD(P)-dependent oxidoreductase [Acidimicrobiales bacterium]|nr:SDR family NAD(P)-dependent oxidoreductase [Acidimicrobiales bacterium]
MSPGRSLHRWNARRIPRLDDRVAVVTGASSGVGFETARYLAEHGATVMLACRDDTKALDAVKQMVSAPPAG